LPVGKSFNIEFRKPGYSSFTQALDLRKVHKYQEKVLDVKLFKTVKLTLNVSDHEIYEPIPAGVKIREKGQNSFVFDVKNNPRDGRAHVDLAVGKDYEIILSADHFKSEILEFNVSGLVIYRNFEKYVELVPEKTEVMLNVSDLVNNSKVKAKVVLKNKNRDEVIEVTGNQMVSLRAGDRYEVEVTSDQGYAFNSTVLDLSAGGALAPVDIRLMKLEKDAKLTLRDINFESNSVQLSDISYTELRRVIQLLRERTLPCASKWPPTRTTLDQSCTTKHFPSSGRRASPIFSRRIKSSPPGMRQKAMGNRRPRWPTTMKPTGQLIAGLS
jgi:hypothetical protein